MSEKYPSFTTIVQNVNTRKTSVVLGDDERVLYGPGYIEDMLCDQRFRSEIILSNHVESVCLLTRNK